MWIEIRSESSIYLLECSRSSGSNSIISQALLFLETISYVELWGNPKLKKILGLQISTYSKYRGNNVPYFFQTISIPIR
jgi:hypothetical protein